MITESIPTNEQLAQAATAEVLDKDGNKYTFGELTNGKRVVVVFIRHFWCGMCQAYTLKFGQSMPPSHLPEGTSVIFIGCGSTPPMKNYINVTKSPYPLYTNPSLSLYNIFNFKTGLGVSKKGQEKDYEQGLGSHASRIWTSLVAATKSVQWTIAVGPKTQNGGEVVLEADGTCSFFHVMQHTADHTSLSDMAKIIGAKFDPTHIGSGQDGQTCEAGVKV